MSGRDVESLVVALQSLARLLAATAESELDALVGEGAEALASADAALDALVDARTDLPPALDAAHARLQSALGILSERRRFSDASVVAAADTIHVLAVSDGQRAQRELIVLYVDALARGQIGACRTLISRALEGVVADDSTRDALRTLPDSLDAGRWDASADAVAVLSDALREHSSRTWARPLLRQLAVARALYLVRAGRGEDAERTLREALQVVSDGRVVAELAHLLAAPDRAAEARALADDAVDDFPDLGDGYLAKGWLADRDSDVTAAFEHYRQGLARLDVQRLARRDVGTLLRPTGLLNRELALRLEAVGLPSVALDAAEAALRSGVIGPELYPDTPLYELRARVLRRRPEHALEAQDAALEAGKRRLWSNDLEAAVEHLEQALPAGHRLPTTGWYLAESLRLLAWHHDVPDPEVVRQGLQVWQQWREAVGPPKAELAWAFWCAANLGHDLVLSGGARGTEVGDLPWRSVMHLEQALILDPNDLDYWSASARFLRALELRANAAESIERGLALDPENHALLHELLALRLEAGEYAFGLDLLRRHELPADPWLSGVRAWMLLRDGDVHGALAHAQDAMSTVLQRGWGLDLSASAKLRLGDVEGAVADLRALTEIDHYAGEFSALRRARAHAVLGDVDRAWEALEHTSALRQTADYWSVRIVVHACSAEPDLAVQHVTDLKRVLHNHREIDDALLLLDEAVTILGGPTAATPAVRVLRVAIADVEHCEARPPLTAADELAAEPTSEVHRIALHAVGGRRALQRDRLDDAVRHYTALLGTEMHPEASLALVTALTRLRDLAIAAGEASRAAELHDRLAVLSPGAQVNRSWVVAEALLAAGEVDQARRAYVAALTETTQPTAQLRPVLRLASLARTPAQTQDATARLHDLHHRSLAGGDHELTTTVEQHLGVLAAATGDTQEATRMFSAALSSRPDGAVTAEPPSAFDLALGIRLAAESLGTPLTPPVIRSYEEACAAHGLDPVPLEAAGATGAVGAVGLVGAVGTRLETGDIPWVRGR